MKKLFLTLSALILLTACGQKETAPEVTMGQPVIGEEGVKEMIVENELELKLYSLNDVALHANEDDCWTAVNGQVFDITEYIPNHPAGNSILQGCGIDGTEIFEKKPNGEPHSEKAVETLNNYLIGNLK